MSFPINNLLTYTRTLPALTPLRTISISSITIPAAHRPSTHPIDLRITFPILPSTTPSPLPLILLSHGHGPSAFLPSKEGYAPLTNALAAQGYAVLQPTHLNSKHAGLTPASHPDGPLFWRSRPRDLSAVIDALDTIEADISAALGRAVSLDRQRIAAVGHSLGGSSVCLILGANFNAADPSAAPSWESFGDARVKAGVLLGAPGLGGAENLTSDALNKYKLGAPDFGSMSAATLVVVGDEDHGAHLTSRGARWHADAYTESVGADGRGGGRKGLLWVRGGKHGFGGVSGWDAKEGDDNDADRLEGVGRSVGAWLRGALGGGWEEWEEVKGWIAGEGKQFGWVEGERGL